MFIFGAILCVYWSAINLFFYFLNSATAKKRLSHAKQDVKTLTFA